MSTQEPKRFTYSGDPSSSSRDAVRFLLGDTDSKRRLLDDREIDYALTEQGGTTQATVFLAQALANRFSGLADIKVGPVSKSYSKVAEMYRKIVDDLKESACLEIEPAFPAISADAKHNLYEDYDSVRPEFYLGMSDHSNFHDLHHELHHAGYYGHW